MSYRRSYILERFAFVCDSEKVHFSCLPFSLNFLLRFFTSLVESMVLCVGECVFRATLGLGRYVKECSGKCSGCGGGG